MTMLNHPRIKFLLPIIVVVFAVLVAYGLIAMKPEVEAVPKPKPVPLVRVQTVSPGEVKFDILSQGEVVAKENLVVSADVAGRILAVNNAFLEGSKVTKGEWLVKIDSANYELALRDAELALADAELNLADEYARLGAKAGTQSAEKVKDNPRVIRAQAQIKAALARVAKAGIDLERTTVVAPASALVARKHVALGQYTNVGATVGELLGLSVAEIRLPVDLNDLNAVQSQLPAEVILKRNDGASWAASIVRAQQQLDRNTRLAYLVAELNNPYQRSPALRFGDFVDARITGLSTDNAVKVPRAALFDNDSVFVVGADATLEARKVEVLRTSGDSAVLRGDFAVGSQIVLDRLALMAPGMSVKVSETSSESANGAAPVSVSTP